MTNISLLERIKTIIDLVKSQSFFITLFVILLLTIIVLVINNRVNSKAPKYAIAITYTGLTVLLLARYGQYMLSLNDSIVDKFFRAMYFPNIVVYLSTLIITILFLALVIINEKCLKYTKICSLFSFFLIWFLFVLTVDSVKKEGLSFYEVTDIYANSTIMILMQASMCIFAIWCGVMISDVIIRKLSGKIDNKEEIKEYTNEEFMTNTVSNNTNIYNNLNNQNNNNFTNKL